MADISFCPNCGAPVEGERNTCSCCGAILREAKNQQQEFGATPPLDSLFNQQGFGNVPPPQNQFSGQNFGQTPPHPMQYENYNQYAQNDGAYNGCAIAGLVLGIISIVMCCLLWLNIILGIAGIVLSIVGFKSFKYKGCAIAGLVCSIAGTLSTLVLNAATWF